MKQPESRLTRKYLMDHGIRPSTQRIAIMQFLLDNHTHPTAEEIHLKLLPKIPSLSKTTVYNTMKLFIRKGVAIMIDIDGRNARFDGDVSTHAHFQCRSCNRIFDLAIPGLYSTISLEEEYSVESVCLNMRGLCPECNRRKQAESGTGATKANRPAHPSIEQLLNESQAEEAMALQLESEM